MSEELTIRLGNFDVRGTPEGSRFFLTPEPGAPSNLLTVLDDAAQDIVNKLPVKYQAQAHEERNGIVIETKGGTGIDWTEFNNTIRSSIETAFSQSTLNQNKAMATGVGNSGGGSSPGTATGSRGESTEETEALKTG